MLAPKYLVLVLSLLFTETLAARPFLNEPDTGIEESIGAEVANGTLPNVTSILGLPDFDWVARHRLNISSYTYYRAGAAGEWSYRNNLEAFQRVRFRPRVMIDVTNIEASLPTTILGYNFSAPFYISPCAIAGYAHEDGELNFVKGANEGKILYMVSDFSSKDKDSIRDAIDKESNQVLFQQLYISADLNATRAQVKRAEDDGFKAIILTVDEAAEGNRHRGKRFGVGSANSDYTYFTWDYWKEIQSFTELPVVPKGINTWEDAVIAAKMGAKAIYISNHGARQLDGVPSPLEVALEIHEQAPWVFQQVEVFADGGVRYGADALKLLALGVKAVGLGRPFMYSNVFGVDGVKRAIDLFKNELAVDAGNLGVADLKQINTSFVSYKPNGWMG
ncbi:hypothetical protein AAF712_000104 [Marasmius tenuissimus]|uniref:FMN hydroxy acid dehydrogenase domain-containing protein n=1 Tax=Marasmius tenuissimus TaxID=585030 RepID=A0ABR3AEN5_9AGAR|nr:hypothetical protein PM082_000836 [Marasmius tenuissimus]